MATLTPSVSDLRTLLKDPNVPSSYNLVVGEVPRSPQGATYGAGTTTLFYLANKPVVSGSIFVTQGTTYRQTIAAAGVTADLVNGILTFASAPTSPVFLVDYNFNYFADADYQSFLNEALRFIGQASTASIDELLATAVYDEAKAQFYMAMATQYAIRYSSSGGSVGTNVDSVTKNYLALHKAAHEKAVEGRDDYYKRQGQREAPSSHFSNYGTSPITPRR